MSIIIYICDGNIDEIYRMSLYLTSATFPICLALSTQPFVKPVLENR